jgi:hypothetical protein
MTISEKAYIARYTRLMRTLYELEAEVIERARRTNRDSERQRLLSDSAAALPRGRTPSLRLALALRAMADRLEERALRMV